MNTIEPLQQALNFLRSGAYPDCVRTCNALLSESPGLVQALYLRGCASYHTGDVGQSINDLDVVFGNHPEHLNAAYYLGRSMRAAGQYEQALVPLDAATQVADLAIRARYELAVCLTALRRRPEAIEQYESILTIDPDNAQVVANLASLLERENRLGAADETVTRALSQDSNNDTARMTRAILNRRAGNLTEAASELNDLIRRVEHPINRSIAWNQLGQCMEGQGTWDQAFAAFGESNRILKAHHPNAIPDSRGPHGLETLARIHEWLETNPIDNWSAPAAAEMNDVAFLVGFPRSGTTLLDRLLAAHPDIEVLEEKSLFSHLHQDWSQPGTLEGLENVSEKQIADARTIYRREMTRHRQRPEKSLVVDKLPLNLTYIFLINRLFPQAPILFLLRNPMDVCTSCFSQAFELEASMGYFLDLDVTARYYDAVMKVATCAREQVGNPLYALHYENLVTEPDKQIASLLQFLEMPLLASGLAGSPAAESSTSNTPSYQQVSQPLYERSIGRWRHYSGQFRPVLGLLQPWADRFGYRHGDRPG